MKTVWIALGFLVALSSADIALNEDYDGDYWQNDYNDQWYQDELDKLNGDINYLDTKPYKPDDKDISAKDGARNDDYQIEDNRYVSDEKEQQKQNDLLEENMAASVSDENNSQDIPVINNDEVIEKDLLKEDTNELNDPENESQDFEEDSDSISFENNNNQDLPVAPDVDKIIKETQDLLRGEDSKIEDLESQELIPENDGQDANLNIEEEKSKLDLSDEDVKSDDNIYDENNDSVSFENNNKEDIPALPGNDKLFKETQESKIEDSENQSQELIQENDEQDAYLSVEKEKNILDLSNEDVKNDNDYISQVDDDDDMQDESNSELDPVVEVVEPNASETINQVEKASRNFDKLETNENNKLKNVEEYEEEANDFDTNEDSIDENKSSINENNFDSIETNENPRKVSDTFKSFQNNQENDEDIVKSDEDVDKSMEDIYNSLNVDLDKLLDTLQKLSNDVNDNQNVTEKPKDKNEVLDYEEKYDRPFREGVVLQMRQNDDYDFDKDSSESNESLNEDNNDNINDIEQNPQHVSFGEDAFEDLKQENKQLDNVENLSEQNASKNSEQLSNPESETKLSDDEVQKLMNQFVLDHAEELDTGNQNFNRDIASVNMQINYEEPLQICSPNYPAAYPANNIIDWMFDGDGMGIELNITDLALNNILGDFLLVKPGGIDASGNDGLIFAYTLNTERKYRFMDVDRIFIRFHTHQGLNMFRGFCLSVKLMGPIPMPPEPLPIPEPSMPVVQDRHTVYFGSMNKMKFEEIREDFRLIIANMAELYINTHDVPAGEMALIEVANITSVSYCNVNWPGHEECIAVTFGVPLKYDEDTNLPYRLHEQDLKMMWDALSIRDPFATMIKQLGLTEFTSPNDGLILIMWLLIGCGVLLVLVLFSLTLWKWNFLQDYTRMGSFSDTDSITSHKKKDPALFPTPYQDLPALYSDQTHVYNYKFAPDSPAADDSTRVDMGGYTNRTFTGDRMYGFDSDDEVDRTTARGERYTTDV